MKRLLLFTITLFTITQLQSQGWGQTQKVVASDRASGDEYGWSVAIQDDFAFIGAHLDNNPNISEGSVYVLQNDGSGTWNEVQKLSAPDKFTNDFFGFSVATDGNILMVGARNQDFDENNSDLKEAAGAVYFFEKDGLDTWNFAQKVVAPDRAVDDVFGESIAISGDYAIIMAPLEDEDENDENTLNASGSGYVFERDMNGIWNFVQKLVISNRGDADTIGREGSVSINGNTIAIGVMLDDEDENNANTVINAGAVYVFERDGSGVWSETQKIVAPTRFESDLFGRDVALDGDFMIVGAALKDVANENSGSAYVFKNVAGVWQEIQQLAPTNSDFDYRFGNTVDIEGNRLIVGAFNEQIPDGGAGLSFAGAAYVFEKDGSDFWNLEARIGALDPASSDNFSFDIGISGDFIIGGAYREDEDENGENSMSDPGSAYVFDVNEPNTIPTLSIVENNFGLEFKAYPNPNQGNFTINLGKIYNQIRVSITNSLGQEIQTQKIQSSDNVTLNIDTKSGMYFVNISTEKGTSAVLKILKI